MAREQIADQVAAHELSQRIETLAPPRLKTEPGKKSNYPQLSSVMNKVLLPHRASSGQKPNLGQAGGTARM